MARRRLVVGNWKMNCTVPEAVSLVEGLIPILPPREDVEVVLCPPYTSLSSVAPLLAGTHVKLGAQDVFWEESGAFTGRVSVRMLADLGCVYCIVGHSECRGRFGGNDVPPEVHSYFSDTDRTVNLKVRRLLYSNITPILCVGETRLEREDGRTEDVVFNQLAGCLNGVEPDELQDACIAYEPVWAIGTGIVCDPPEADRMCSFLRTAVSNLLSQDVANRLTVLYGGSVTASNAKFLMEQAAIDGALVGGASLKPEEFARIVASVQERK